jgi:hypothetical protein
MRGKLKIAPKEEYWFLHIQNGEVVYMDTLGPEHIQGYTEEILYHEFQDNKVWFDLLWFKPVGFMLVTY